MLGNTASRLLLPVVRNAAQKRGLIVCSGPPTQHVPKGELYVLGISILVVATAYPLWILGHVKDYKSRPE